MENYFYKIKYIFFFIILFMISDFSGYGQTPYVTIWKTNNVAHGTSDSNQILVPAIGSYSYTWEEVGHPNNSGSGTGTGDELITFPHSGIYQLQMLPTSNVPFSGISFKYNPSSIAQDNVKLIDIEQWGSVSWTSFEYAYSGATHLTITATDKPDLSRITNISYAFYNTKMDSIPNLNSWDVTKVQNMSHLFAGDSNFNQYIGDWDVSNVEDMSAMFEGNTHFNQPLGTWHVDKVKNMNALFHDAKQFNQPIGAWNVSRVEDMAGMFAGAVSFNQPIDHWNVTKVHSMNNMFNNARKFNQPIGNWDVQNVTDMGSMFEQAFSFNQPIGQWQVGRVEEMYHLFLDDTSFNQPIGGWDVSHVQSMNSMFEQATHFNQPIDDWDVSQVTFMDNMFWNATHFGQPLNSWDVSRVRYMDNMFHNAKKFDQTLENWNLAGLNDDGRIYAEMSFKNSGMSCENYSRTLLGWAINPATPSRVNLDATGLQYSKVVQHFYDSLSKAKEWNIYGDTEGNCPLFGKIFDASAIKIYPNPAHSFIIITGLDEGESIKLIDITGRTLQSWKTDGGSKQLDLSAYADGVYSVMVFYGNYQLIAQKIVKVEE